jgi:hypothetical protein
MDQFSFRELTAQGALPYRANISRDGNCNQIYIYWVCGFSTYNPSQLPFGIGYRAIYLSLQQAIRFLDDPLPTDR